MLPYFFSSLYNNDVLIISLSLKHFSESILFHRESCTDKYSSLLNQFWLSEERLWRCDGAALWSESINRDRNSRNFSLLLRRRISSRFFHKFTDWNKTKRKKNIIIIAGINRDIDSRDYNFSPLNPKSRGAWVTPLGCATIRIQLHQKIEKPRWESWIIIIKHNMRQVSVQLITEKRVKKHPN